MIPDKRYILKHKGEEYEYFIRLGKTIRCVLCDEKIKTNEPYLMSDAGERYCLWCCTNE